MSDQWEDAAKQFKPDRNKQPEPASSGDPWADAAGTGELSAPATMPAPIPAALKGGDVGKRALASLPGSAVNFVKNTNLPGMIGQPPMQDGETPQQYTGRLAAGPSRTVGDLAAPFKAAGGFVKNLMHDPSGTVKESFSEDPVGTIGFPAIAAKGAIGLARNPAIQGAVSGAAKGVIEGAHELPIVGKTIKAIEKPIAGAIQGFRSASTPEAHWPEGTAPIGKPMFSGPSPFGIPQEPDFNPSLERAPGSPFAVPRGTAYRAARQSGSGLPIEPKPQIMESEQPVANAMPASEPGKQVLPPQTEALLEQLKDATSHPPFAPTRPFSKTRAARQLTGKGTLAEGKQ